MNQDQLFEVLASFRRTLTRYELSSEDFLVVSGGALLALEDSPRETSDDVDLVVSERACAVLEKKLGWKNVAGAVGVPILVGDVDGIKFEAGATWGTRGPYDQVHWGLRSLQETGKKRKGFWFADPRWVAVWKAQKAGNRTVPAKQHQDKKDRNSIRQWLEDPKRREEYPDLDYFRALYKYYETFFPHLNEWQKLSEAIMSGMMCTQRSRVGRVLLRDYALDVCAGAPTVVNDAAAIPHDVTWSRYMREDPLNAKNRACLPPGLSIELGFTDAYPEREPVTQMTEPLFEELAHDLFNYTVSSLKPLGRAAHVNVAHVKTLYRALEDQFQKVAYPRGIEQLSLLAAFALKWGNPGGTRRSELKTLLYPALGVDVSHEAVAMTAVDRWAARQGIPLPARVFLAHMLDAADDEERKPTYLGQLLAQNADTCGVEKKKSMTPIEEKFVSLDRMVQRNIANRHDEVLASSRISDGIQSPLNSSDGFSARARPRHRM